MELALWRRLGLRPTAVTRGFTAVRSGPLIPVPFLPVCEHNYIAGKRRVPKIPKRMSARWRRRQVSSVSCTRRSGPVLPAKKPTADVSRPDQDAHEIGVTKNSIWWQNERPKLILNLQRQQHHSHQLHRKSNAHGEMDTGYMTCYDIKNQCRVR